MVLTWLGAKQPFLVCCTVTVGQADHSPFVCVQFWFFVAKEVFVITRTLGPTLILLGCTSSHY